MTDYSFFASVRQVVRHLVLLVLSLLATSDLLPQARAQVLLGDQVIESSVDSNALGRAEAFQTTASLSGTVGA